jgi:outer membrane lipase/esterase
MKTTALRSVLALAVAATLALPAAAFDSLVVFGDSLSDSGNNAAAGLYDPNQVVSGNTYIPANTYKPAFTYSNGPVWATSFAAALGVPLVPSLAGGTNFAFGGATTGTPGPGPNGFPFSLLAQTQQFLGASGGLAPSNGLYVIAGGGNNARAALGSLLPDASNFASVAAAAALAFASDVGTMVDALQAAGAIDILVWNVPNLGLAPAVAATGPAGVFAATTLATLMNQALSQRLSIEGPGIETFDLFGFGSTVAAAPALFGFTNATDACGAVANADCSTYLWWDGIHPTAAAHLAIAQAVQAQVVPIPEPETWALMVAGLAALGWRTRRRTPRAPP